MRAIDTNKMTCAHTNAGDHEFWTIDLKSVYNISCVCIYNINKKNSNINNAQITTGNK